MLRTDITCTSPPEATFACAKISKRGAARRSDASFMTAIRPFIRKNPHAAEVGTALRRRPAERRSRARSPTREARCRSARTRFSRRPDRIPMIAIATHIAMLAIDMAAPPVPKRSHLSRIASNRSTSTTATPMPTRNAPGTTNLKTTVWAKKIRRDAAIPVSPRNQDRHNARAQQARDRACRAAP